MFASDGKEHTLYLIGRSHSLSVKEIADLTETLSTPGAVKYFCGIPLDERARVSDITYHFAGYAAETVRNRVQWLMKNVAPSMHDPHVPGFTKPDDAAAMRLLPNAGDQFSFFAADALSTERESYQADIARVYEGLIKDGGVREPDTDVDARMLERLAIARVLSLEANRKLAIPGLRQFGEIRELENPPKDAMELAVFLRRHDPNFLARKTNAGRSAA